MAEPHRLSYVALVAALRAEFNAPALEAIWIQMREHRYNTTPLGVLAQAVHDAQDVAYSTVVTDELSFRRRQILAALGRQERTGLELAAELGRDQANVSRDLTALFRAGLVCRRPVGLRVLYSAMGGDR